MARIAVDGAYIFDNDVNSLCDGLSGNGVITGLAVTQKGAGANMSVDVALGDYVANDTAVNKSGTTNVVVGAAHATLPRKDIIIADSAGNITCVAGTEYAASPVGSSGPQTSAPVPPDITASKIILAEVWVPAAASTIINSYITDRRITVGVATLAGVQELDNKTLDSSVGKGTWTASGTWTLPAITLGGTVTLGEVSIKLDPAISADGKWSGITETGTAGTALVFGDLVYYQTADSKWELASADNAATGCNFKLGICLLAAADNAATEVLLWGKVNAATAFPTLTIGAPVYMSTTAGDVVTTAPSGTTDIIRVVGYGNTADELYFCPSLDWFEHV